MRLCESCGKQLPDLEDFCGYCGRTSRRSPGHPSEALTSRGEPLAAVEEDDVEARPTVITPHWEWDEAPLGNMRQDQGIPQGPGGNFAQEGNAAPAQYSTPTSHLPAPQYAPPSPTLYRPMQASPLHQPPHPRFPQHPYSPHRPTPGGCAPTWLILLFAAIIIITSIISIGLTVLSPSLSLIGGTDVILGDSLHLHGSGFIPESAVILTLDDTTPLYFTDDSSTRQASLNTNTALSLGMPALHEGQTLSSNSIVKVGIDGTFNVTISIDASWHAGQHTIRASERTFPRSVVITITVHQLGETPTPTPSSSDTATPSPSLTASPSATPAGLNCVNPSSVTLGPVSENYNSAVSTQVSLCAAGSGIVHWTASWDQHQAPWLSLDSTTGQVQAPGQQSINVSTLAAKLKAGIYSTTVTFSSQQSSTAETLNVTFIVQTGCIHTSSRQLSFTGIEKASDPQAQTLTVSNCGIVGSWSSSLSTGNNVNWLSIAPAGGALNSGAVQNVTVTASNLKAQLGAGTYSGKIAFSIGSNQITVNVTLTVASAPKILLISPSSGSFDANKDCTSAPSGWTCSATISNNSNILSLSWKSASTGVANITFSPATGTLAPNGTEKVQIFVPANNCQTPTTFTFKGPANGVNISWSCAAIPPKIE